MYVRKYILLLGLMVISVKVSAESGEALWMRYLKLPSDLQSLYIPYAQVYFEEGSSTIEVAKQELAQAFVGLTGVDIKFQKKPFKCSLLIGKNVNQFWNIPDIEKNLKKCANEGFVIRTVKRNGVRRIIVTANTDAGILYGTFALIRLMQTGCPLDSLNIIERPKYKFRLLNHWDNLDGTVERGYAGRSIWWNRKETLDALKHQYLTYARANASIGINGTVLNNVNANPKVLDQEYIEKFARFADLLRPYNIKVFMSINFSSPVIIGGLPSSDPLREDVQQWWNQKVKEIYEAIPDFGGFLVKANSEGQPGPQDYGRSHADGANMLARALEPYGGIVMWRAFVYSPSGDDRAKQAYDEFVPLDGQFRDNVIIQVKNGPIDFQPREPFSPLFGAMEKTPLMIEFQITQEYLGFSDHLVYLAPLQKECLDSDTYVKSEGSTVAIVTNGTLFKHQYSAIAGVANIGRDINWTGHHFAQANWYAFGRLAWNHNLKPEDIAREWIKMTFTHDSVFVESVLDIMMRSREAVVNYMTPMGLHHLMGWDHHYGPAPWTDIEGARPDWLPRYYHNASEEGIGFNRSKSGSNAVSQYAEPLCSMFNNPKTCPQNLLLWFHHLPWDYRLSSGLTLWQELCYHYYRGVDEVKLMQKKWDRLRGRIDDERFEHVQHKLKVQVREAKWWRDACVLYFQTFSKMPIPYELERPEHDLDELMNLKFDMKNHN